MVKTILKEERLKYIRCPCGTVFSFDQSDIKDNTPEIAPNVIHVGSFSTVSCPTCNKDLSIYCVNTYITISKQDDNKDTVFLSK